MANRQEDPKSIYFGLAVIPLIIPFIAGYDTFGLGFWGWVVVSSIIAAVLAYFAMKNTPILSIICGLVFGLTGQFAFLWYFNNRTSFIQIEVAIPMALGAIPPYLVHLIGSRIKQS